MFDADTETKTRSHHLLARISSSNKWLLLVGTLVVITGWLNSTNVPLYDGLGFPDEPYRYVTSITDQNKTALPPTPASGSVDLKDGTNLSSLNIASLEQGPQIYVLLADHTLWTVPQAATATATFTPLSPSGTKPSKGSVIGNIYNFSLVSSPNATITFQPNKRVRSAIDLRLPQGSMTDVNIGYRPTDSSSWQALTTTQVGNDIYEAPIAGLGDYSFIPRPSEALTAKKLTPDRRGRVLTTALIFVVFVLAGVTLFIRLKKAKSQKVASQEPDA